MYQRAGILLYLFSLGFVSFFSSCCDGQIVREGRDAMLNPPGSYCAYASVYLTVCLIRIFGLATKTYLEQQLHVGIIQVRNTQNVGCFFYVEKS